MSYVIVVTAAAGATVHGNFANEASAESTAERWNRAFYRQWPVTAQRPRAFAMPVLGKDAATRDRIWSPDGAVGRPQEAAAR